MDPYASPYYDQTYFASNYQPGPAISVTNYAVNRASYASRPSSTQTPSQQFETGHGSILTSLIDDEDLDSNDHDVLPELTIKVFRKGSGGKNYVVRSIQTANISNDTAFREFVVHEFGNKVCGEAKSMEIGYFKGNKRVWIRTGDDYSQILGKLRSGSTITLWCECSPGRKRAVESDEHSDSDSDGTQKNSSSTLKRRRKSLSEEKNACVQEIFQKLKTQHGDKYTGPQYRLWAEAIDVNQHSSYNEHPQGSFFSAMQGRAHGVRKSGSSDVLTTAVTTLATSLAAALQPPCSESSNNSAHKSAGSSTPPQRESRSPVITPVRAAQLKTTYITQIKELHSLVEIGALTPEQYEDQQDSILQQMDRLNPRK